VYLAADEVFATSKLLWLVWRRTHSARALWATFVGHPQETADKVAAEMVRQAA
jgi:hypothetical protein